MSIKEIFSEKVNKLGKFEKEMKELEKDVRLNYNNIIRLMDLEPFYEIIYRYNKKLNNIKSVFTEFKGKPDEIPEDAIKVKSLRNQLGFVSGLGKKLENFFADIDSYDSNLVSQEGDYTERGLESARPFAELTVTLIEPVQIPPRVSKITSCLSRSTQTQRISDFDEPARRKILGHS